MQITTELISWILTIIAAGTAVYFNFKSSRRDDSKSRRENESGVIADLKLLLQEYRTRLEALTGEALTATAKISGLEAEIVLLERRIRDMRLEVLELNQIIINTARDRSK